MTQFAGNGLTLKKLEQFEEAARRCQTSEAKAVLRLAAALREALQIKVNACAFCPRFENILDRDPDSSASSNGHFNQDRVLAKKCRAIFRRFKEDALVVHRAGAYPHDAAQHMVV